MKKNKSVKSCLRSVEIVKFKISVVNNLNLRTVVYLLLLLLTKTINSLKSNGNYMSQLS
jgi:hypothetical protein